MKLLLISALAAVSGLTAAALPWLESAPAQRATCVVAGAGGNNPPYIVVCPTQANPV
jgi:hypothetical protein